MTNAKKKHAVLITGGSRRLGLVFAKTCLDLGYAVIIHYHNTAQPAQRQLSPIASNDLFFIKAPLETEPENLIDRALTFPVKLYGLVNCASVFTKGNLSDPAHFQAILNINAFAPVRLSARFYEKILKGWIINITDAHIKLPNRNYQNYRLSKLLLEEITRQQAYLFAPRIRVNAIAPGAMLPAVGKDKAFFKSLNEEIPLRRTGDISALVDAFKFLCKNSYITGETIRVDGGWHLVG